MRALVGQALTRTLDLRLGAVPLTGAVVTYALTDPAGVAVVVGAPAETEVGIYSVDLTAAQLATSGLYQETWVVTSTGDTYSVDGWFVLTPWMPGLVPRWELRHRVAHEVRDLTLGTAASGSATTLVDSGRWEPDNHWLGAEVYLYGGTGRGESRRCVASASGSGTLTVSQVWTTPPVNGTLYELHKRFSVDDYNRALERTLSRHRHTVMLPIEVSNLATTRDNHFYTVPPAFDTVRRVEWRPNPWATDLTRWWTLEPGDWELHSGRRLYVRCPHDATVRLLGEMAWDDLPSDDSLTGGPVEWLVLRSAATLLGTKLTSQAADAQGWREQLTYLEKAASDSEPRSRPRPNSRRVKA
jgi:hypothetical protein